MKQKCTCRQIFELLSSVIKKISYDLERTTSIEASRYDLSQDIITENCEVSI